jgi:hypothetical protein
MSNTPEMFALVFAEQLRYVYIPSCRASAIASSSVTAGFGMSLFVPTSTTLARRDDTPAGSYPLSSGCHALRTFSKEVRLSKENTTRKTSVSV